MRQRKLNYTRFHEKIKEKFLGKGRRYYEESKENLQKVGRDRYQEEEKNKKNQISWFVTPSD